MKKKNSEKAGSFPPIPGWIVFHWNYDYPAYTHYLVRDTPENRGLIAKAHSSRARYLVGFAAFFVGCLGVGISVSLGHGLGNPAAIAFLVVAPIGLLVAIMSSLARERSRSAVMSSEGIRPLGCDARRALSDLAGTIQADGPLIAEGAEKGVVEEVILRVLQDRRDEEDSRRRAMVDSVMNTQKETR